MANRDMIFLSFLCMDIKKSNPTLHSEKILDIIEIEIDGGTEIDLSENVMECCVWAGSIFGVRVWEDLYIGRFMKGKENV